VGSVKFKVEQSFVVVAFGSHIIRCNMYCTFLLPKFLLDRLSIKMLWLLLLAFPVCYATYQWYFHPLAKFPGPFWAKISPLWRAYHLVVGDTPTLLVDLHNKYGPVIRIAPNELDVNDADVIGLYKQGRTALKSEFYDGFTAIKPNLFGTRDEDPHALRRRQMAHSFSAASMARMDEIFDRNVTNIRTKLDKYAKSGEIFDLATIFAFLGMM
jgi:hypothetical protein